MRPFVKLLSTLIVVVVVIVIIIIESMESIKSEVYSSTVATCSLCLVFTLFSITAKILKINITKYCLNLFYSITFSPIDAPFVEVLALIIS